MSERDSFAQDTHPDRPPSPEDLVLLQSTVESLRQERDQLLRRLQLAESSARERVQLAESRAREASAQVEALKRAAQQARESLEDKLRQAREQLAGAQLHGHQWQQAAEALRRRATELETLLEAAQLRVADLETENSVLTAEVDRLRGELETLEQRWVELQARFEILAQERVADRQAAERAQKNLEQLSLRQAELQREIQAAQQLATERAAHSESLAALLQQAESRIRELEQAIADLRTQSELASAAAEQARREAAAELARREEAWVQERDRLARAYEEEQNRSVLLERDLDAVRAQLCSLQLRLQHDTEEQERLRDELHAARADLQRERAIFEELARRREAEWAEALDTLRQENAAVVAQWQERSCALEQASKRQEEELRRLQELLSASQSEIAALAAKLASREEEIAALQFALREAELRRTEAEELVAALQARINGLEAEVAAAQQEVLNARQVLAESKDTFAAERQAWDQHKAELLAQLAAEQRRSAAELAQADEQLRALKATLAAASVEAYGRGLEWAETAAQAASWTRRARQLQQEYTALQEQYDATVQAAQAQLAALHLQVEELLRDRDIWRQQASNLEAQLAESHKARERLEAEKHRWQATNEELRSEVSLLRESLQGAEEQARVFAQSLEQEKACAAQLTVEQLAALREREEQIADLRCELERRSHDIALLEHALHEARSELEKVAASATEVDALRERVTSLEQRLGESQETVANLEAELARALAALAAERDRSNDSQKQISGLTAELQQAREAQAEALATLQTTRAHLEELQEQSVTILQNQETLIQENQDLLAELERWAKRWEEQEEVLRATQRERDEAIARFRELELLREQERAEQLKVRQQLDAERESLRNALEAQRAQQAQLQAQLALLQKDKATRIGVPGHDLVELERERAELKTQVEKLSAVIRQLGQEREEQRVAALQAQASLTARLDELAAERGALTLRVAELETLASQLERECERLRRERLSPEELRRYKAEIARLEARVEELERLRSEAAQNHSAVVASYLTELTQRTEALQAREAELSRVEREAAELRALLEDTQAQLDAEREERAQLQAALDELRRATTFSGPRPAARVTTKGSTMEQPPRGAPGSVHVADAASLPRAFAATTSSLARCLEARELTVVHLEENKDCRDQVQRLVRQRPHVRYLNTTDFGEVTKDGAVLLAVNLLNRVHDPIAALSRFVRATHPCGIFAYCAEGKYGFLFGEAAFFAAPFDTDACATWLLSSATSAQRLLVASNNIEMTSELRAALTKIRCSTSVALDFRQAIELLPLIQPEVVVVDLALPRADGLRLISRLRNDEKTASIPLGVILPEHQRVAELRQNAARAARDGTLTVDTLVRALAAELGLPPPEASTAVTGTAPSGR